MSWTTPSASADRRPSACRALRSRAWHVFCIPALLSSGCYFWLPLVEEQPNEPPEIRESYPAEGERLDLDLPEVIVYVRVVDKNDPEELSYQWEVNGLGEEGRTEPLAAGSNIYGSRLTLPRDTLYDGRELQVTVVDSFGDSDQRSWLIVVPEEAP